MMPAVLSSILPWSAMWFPIIGKVAELASPTGHWPEAVHPQNLGGCMGDGQHAWSAAEWIMMIHTIFAAEEGDNLNLPRGIPQKWQQSSRPLTIGPTHTRFGVPEIVVESSAETVAVRWKARWHTPPDGLFIRLTGTAPVQVESPGDRSGRIILSRNPDGG